MHTTIPTCLSTLFLKHLPPSYFFNAVTIFVTGVRGPSSAVSRGRRAIFTVCMASYYVFKCTTSAIVTDLPRFSAMLPRLDGLKKVRPVHSFLLLVYNLSSAASKITSSQHLPKSKSHRTTCLTTRSRQTPMTESNPACRMDNPERVK